LTNYCGGEKILSPLRFQHCGGERLRCPRGFDNCVTTVRFVTAAGKLQCVCTTPECHRDGTAACRADNFCYVQVIPPVSASGSGALDDVTRGCIDDDTPLLCENQRPSTYRGAWPVLHCCTDDWCNRDVIPTLPPWASHVEGYQNTAYIPNFPITAIK